MLTFLVTTNLLCLDFPNLRWLECSPGQNSLLIQSFGLSCRIEAQLTPLAAPVAMLGRSPAQGQGPAASPLTDKCLWTIAGRLPRTAGPLSAYGPGSWDSLSFVLSRGQHEHYALPTLHTCTCSSGKSSASSGPSFAALSRYE